ADRIEGQVAPQLQPDFGADIVQHRRLEAGLGHHFRNGRYALAGGTVEFANRETVAFDVLDDARSDQFGCRINHATDHAFCRDFFQDDAGRVHAAHRRTFELAAVLLEVPVGNAVLHRDDGGVRAIQLGQIICNRLNLVSLERQDDQILRAGFVVAVGSFHVAGNVLGTIIHDELHAILANCLKIGTAHDEGHVFTRQSELNADVTSDGTGSYNCYFHTIFLNEVN